MATNNTSRENIYKDGFAMLYRAASILQLLFEHSMGVDGKAAFAPSIAKNLLNVCLGTLVSDKSYCTQFAIVNDFFSG